MSGGAPELEGGLGVYTDVKSTVAAVADFFGPADILSMIDQTSSVEREGPDCPEAVLIDGAVRLNPDKARAASPVSYVSAGDPPVLIVHGSADRVVPYQQSVDMDGRLTAAGVPSFFVTVTGAGHGDFGTAADSRLLAFFDRFLCGMKAEISTAPIAWKKR